MLPNMLSGEPMAGSYEELVALRKKFGLGIHEGKVRDTTGQHSVEVLYKMWEIFENEISGRIFTPDREPAAQFMKNHRGPGTPALVWQLETTQGLVVQITFTDPGGRFKCLDPAHARAAVIY